MQNGDGERRGEGACCEKGRGLRRAALRIVRQNWEGGMDTLALSGQRNASLPGYTDLQTELGGRAVSYLRGAAPPPPAFWNRCIGRKARAMVANPEFSTPTLRHYYPVEGESKTELPALP